MLDRSDSAVTDWNLRGPWRLKMIRSRDHYLLRLTYSSGWTIERSLHGVIMTPELLSSTLADMHDSVLSQVSFLAADLAAVTLDPENRDADV